LIALKFLAGLTVLIALVIFSLKNIDPQVSIIYYFGKSLGPMPFSFALLGSAVLGSVVAALFTLVEQIKLRGQIKKQNTKISMLEDELLELQSRPPEPLPEESEGDCDPDVDGNERLELPPKSKE